MILLLGVSQEDLSTQLFHICGGPTSVPCRLAGCQIRSFNIRAVCNFYMCVSLEPLPSSDFRYSLTTLNFLLFWVKLFVIRIDQKYCKHFSISMKILSICLTQLFYCLNNKIITILCFDIVVYNVFFCLHGFMYFLYVLLLLAASTTPHWHTDCIVLNQLSYLC